MIEEWLPIKNYEGLYEVSNLGRIKNCNRSSKNKNGFRNIKERILKQGNYIGKTNRGYMMVTLSKNCIKETKQVHKLVAEAFIEKITNKNCINHIDGNKQNNNINNLEWCTYKENTIHMFKLKEKK